MDLNAFLRPLVAYNEAFAARDQAHRLRLLADSMTPDAQIWGPKRVFAGYQEISEKIEGFHKNWPECRLVLASGLNTFLNAARMGTAIIGTDGAIRAFGHAVIELADDGRIHRVIPFWEPLPLLPADWPAHLAPGQASSAPGTTLEGSCHCGAVRLTLPSAPHTATDCNCSLCRRLGGPWVYYEFGTVKIEGHPERTSEYIWGDKTLRTVRCGSCGCVTHWEPLNPIPGAKHGVNLGNFPPSLLASVRVRRLDGADTWKFLD